LSLIHIYPNCSATSEVYFSSMCEGAESYLRTNTPAVHELFYAVRMKDLVFLK